MAIYEGVLYGVGMRNERSGWRAGETQQFCETESYFNCCEIFWTNSSENHNEKMQHVLMVQSTPTRQEKIPQKNRGVNKIEKSRNLLLAVNKSTRVNQD